MIPFHFHQTHSRIFLAISPGLATVSILSCWQMLRLSKLTALPLPFRQYRRKIVKCAEFCLYWLPSLTPCNSQPNGPNKKQQKNFFIAKCHLSKEHKSKNGWSILYELSIAISIYHTNNGYLFPQPSMYVFVFIIYWSY